MWPGAAPMEAGTGRVSIGVGGAWKLLDPLWIDLDAPVAGAGGGLAAAWAPTRRLAVTVAGGGAALTTGASGLAALGTVRYLAYDGDRLRVAPWVAGGLLDDDPRATGGLALEAPFYAVLVDVSVPLGGVAFRETPAFLPTMLLAELGFTWRLGEHTSFRLGYVAAAASWGWRWRGGPWTIEVSGYTNVLSGSLSSRIGLVF